MSTHATQEPAKSNPFDAKKPAPAPTPTPPPADAAPAPVVAKKTAGKQDVDYAKPWADEVDGVPTGAKARHDDDDQIVSTETTTRPKTSYSTDKKPGQKATEATHTVTRTGTTTKREGLVTDTEEKANSVGGNWKEKKVEAGRTRSSEHKIGDGDSALSTKNTRGGSADIGKGGGGVRLHKDLEVKAGDKYKGQGQEVTAGYRDGHVAAELKRTKRSGDADSERSEERTYGLNEGRVQVGFGKNHDYNNKSESRGQSSTFGVGTNSVAGTHTRTQTAADGSKRSLSGGASLDTNGNASANAGYSRTTAGGTKISGNAKAGLSVEASDPVEVKGGWQVTYKRTKTMGASGSVSKGGSSSGAGFSGGASHDSYDVGTRTFKTKAEALDFQKHAAKRVRSELPDPTSLAGAMSLEIGETLGSGTGDTLNFGASASFEGATLSYGKTKESTEETSVRRVSANIFEVTSSAGKKNGSDLGLSGNGIGLNRGSSENSGHAVTARFDLGTPEGQAAFQLFCKTGLPPVVGGKIVSRTESEGEESHEGVDVFGLLSDTHQRRSWESRTIDEEGKHEEFGGEKSHTVKTGRIGRFLGDKNITESVRVIGRQEDDKTSDYTFEAHYGGESGKTNRKNLARLTGDYDDTGAKSDKSSGDWLLSADVKRGAMQKMIAGMDRFKGITGNDAQMRAVAEMLKKEGAGTALAVESYSDEKLNWDLELKGDKNFPGKVGRLELEAKVQKYSELMKISLGTPQLIVNDLQREIGDLEKRKAAVKDTAKYPDLPIGLRNSQLDLIDSHIAALQSIRHQGLMEMTKNNPLEDASMIGVRLYDEKGYDDLPPNQRELAKMRDEIGMLDGQITNFEQQNMKARLALQHAVGHYTDEKAAKAAGSDNRNEVRSKLESGKSKDDEHHFKSIGEIDDLRMQFILHMTTQPNVAKAYGNTLKKRLETQLGALQEANANLYDSARIQSHLNDKKALQGKHAAFWADVSDDVEVSGYEMPEKKPDPYARTYTPMALP